MIGGKARAGGCGDRRSAAVMHRVVVERGCSAQVGYAMRSLDDDVAVGPFHATFSLILLSRGLLGAASSCRQGWKGKGNLRRCFDASPSKSGGGHH